MDSHIRFSGRLFFSTMNYYFKQLPPHYGIKLNGDRFHSCITYLRETQRVESGPWENGPGYRPDGAEDNPPPFRPCHDNLVSQDSVREAKWKRWEAYYNKTASHIPCAVARPGKVGPRPYPRIDSTTDDEEDDEDMVGPISESSPSCESEEETLGNLSGA